MMDASGSEPITFLLPFSCFERGENSIICRPGKRDFEPYELATLLCSIDTYYCGGVDDLLIIIVPEVDLVGVQLLVEMQSLKIKTLVITESSVLKVNIDLLPVSPDGLTGWYFQQLIKLAASALISTRFYITLDSDVILAKNCCYLDFISDKKGYVNVETPEDYLGIYTTAFAEEEVTLKKSRYRDSAKILGVPEDFIESMPIYNETPVILHTETVKRLLIHLDNVFNENWMAALMRKQGWTEYSLYFLFSHFYQYFSKSHQLASVDYVVDLPNSVYQQNFKYRVERDYRMDSLFRPSCDTGRFFVVIQSWIDPQAWLPSDVSSKKEFYFSICRHLKLENALACF
jgi:Family of unknown function (DUF6492)